MSKTLASQGIRQRHSAQLHLPPGWVMPPEPTVTIKFADVVYMTRLDGTLK